MPIRPKKLVFGGVRVENFDETVAFFRDVLGLRFDHADEGLVSFRLHEEGTFEVFSKDEPDHQFMTTGPVIGFGVDDVDATRAELETHEVEFLGPTQAEGDYKWAHFRGPDGNVYEITKS